MEWNQDDVRWAFRIFMRLVRDGQIEHDPEYSYHYQDPNVRLIIEDIIEKEADIKVFEAGECLYLSAGVDNRYFGYTNEELRTKMKLDNNQELYLAYFAMLCLLAKFYNSDDQAFTSRQFLPLEELEETITTHVEEISEASSEEVEAVEVETKLSLSVVASLWKEMPAFDDTLKYQRRGKNNRISFLLRVLAFLEAEGLVQVLEDREIRLLPKLEHLVVKYYFHSQRKDFLLQLLSEPLILVPKETATVRKEEA